MLLRWLIAILVLPGTVAVLVPATLQLATRGPTALMKFAAVDTPQFWAAVVLSGFGLSFGLWTMALFWRIGQGTPAPWDPPARLVVKGPYRHVRNPMITSVLAILLAETCIYQSPAIAIWFAIFLLGNLIYFPLSEEPSLAKRFGDDYELYRQHVSRWLPRLTPWDLPPRTDGDGGSESDTDN